MKKLLFASAFVLAGITFANAQSAKTEKKVTENQQMFKSAKGTGNAEKAVMTKEQAEEAKKMEDIQNKKAAEAKATEAQIQKVESSKAKLE